MNKHNQFHEDHDVRFTTTTCLIAPGNTWRQVSNSVSHLCCSFWQCRSQSPQVSGDYLPIWSVNWIQSIVLLSILCMRCIWCVSPYLLPISIYNIPWCHIRRKFSNFNTHIYLWFCMTGWAEDGHTATVYLYPRDIGKKWYCHQKCCGCMGYTVV